MKKRICHIITGLNQGGAENVLCNLVTHPNYKNALNIMVISLQGPGVYAEKLRQAGIEVHCLNLSKWNVLFKLIALVHLIKKIKPTIVQTWMYHANFLGGLAAKWAGCKHIIWGIHDSGMRLSKNTKWINFFCAKLSHLIPTYIVIPSKVSIQNHINKGYAAEKFKFIVNGVSIPPSILLKSDHTPKQPLTIGMLARYHPDKDYPNFIRAIRIINQTGPYSYRFILAGKGVDQSQELIELCKALNLDNVALLPPFAHPEVFYQKLDLFVLSSAMEVLPLTIIEAMSHNIPCVVTEVGDTAYIVADTGFKVPPQNPKALAEACLKMLALSPLERQALGQKARKRIEEKFSVEKMVNAYETLY